MNFKICVDTFNDDYLKWCICKKIKVTVYLKNGNGDNQKKSKTGRHQSIWHGLEIEPDDV